MLTKLIGIPFVDGGRDYSKCDCWGLVKLAAKELYDLDFPDYCISCFDSLNINKACLQDLRSYWTRVKVPQEGAIAVMATDEKAPDLMNHIGLVISQTHMLHTLEKLSSHTIRMDHPFYKHKIKGFWVYNG